MTRISLIAALGRNRVIGNDGAIPWHLPGEQARFKDITMGHTLVMGRKTFDSIGRALPGRRTIVITRSPEWHHEAVETAHSFPEALALAGPGDEVFVAGGGQIYAEAMPYAVRMVLTEVDRSPEGDTYFPEWVLDDWREELREEHDGWAISTYGRIDYSAP
jgi:dihydrofolate reductase